MEFKHGDITAGIHATAFAVHNKLGSRFMEIIYQRALSIELERRCIQFAREMAMPVVYDGIEIGTRRLDFLVAHIICVELKAINVLDSVHFVQLRNYLEVFNLEIGLLLNFGASKLEYRRLENSKFDPTIIQSPSIQKINPKAL